MILQSPLKSFWIQSQRNNNHNCIWLFVELLICMTLTKCHYLLQHKITEGILKKNKIHLCRNNYLLSSGDEVIITVETQQFNLTGDQRSHASVSSPSISINETVMEGITIQEKSAAKQLHYPFWHLFADVSGQMHTVKYTHIFPLEVKNISTCLKPDKLWCHCLKIIEQIAYFLTHNLVEMEQIERKPLLKSRRHWFLHHQWPQWVHPQDTLHSGVVVLPSFQPLWLFPFIIIIIYY